MIDFLIYQGKAAVALAAFYMFYRLLLSKETFHRFNRVVLLGTAAISFILPLCVITIQKVEIMEAYQPAQDYTVMTDIQASAEILETEATTEEPAEETPWWLTALATVFALGVVTIIATTLISINRIKKIISGGRHELLESGEILVITDYNTAPFSWMKYIVLSKEDYESGYSQILTHEKAHIALRHSWDIIFVDMITALQWFNPAIWMLKADLRAIHEYEADDAVLRSGANVKEYQYLLIRKAVSKSGYSVANSFNHSTLKARITMMLNQKSSRMSAWKALYVIPLVGISLAATAETKVDYQYEDQQPVAVADTLDGKDSKNSLPEPKSEFTRKNLREGRFLVDKENNTVTLIYFDSDCKELQVKYTGLDLNKNIYMHNGAIVTKEMQDKATFDDPDVVVIVAYLKDKNRVSAAITKTGPYVTGTINVNEEEEGFTLKSSIQVRTADDEKVEADANDLVIVVNGERMADGFDLNTISAETITSMEVLKTEKALQEYGTDKGVIVITTDPTKANEEKPAPDIYINGKKATSEEIAALPANPKGTISADGTVWITTEDKTVEKPNPDEVVYVVTDKAAELIQNRAPQFQGGGMPEFQKWVHDHIKYPEGVTSEGRVDVSFRITEDGEIADVKVLRGADAKLNEEAIRVIESSGNGWVPAIKDGKKIPITMMVPVIFKK